MRLGKVEIGRLANYFDLNINTGHLVLGGTCPGPVEADFNYN